MRVAALVAALGLGACGSKAKEPPEPPDEVVRVVAQKWAWSFEYASGLVSNELHLPQGARVALDLESRDVVHTLSLLGVRGDAVPGKVTRVIVKAGDVAGVYALACEAACGMPDGGMKGSVFVDEPARYRRWLEEEAAEAEGTPVERGERVFENKGCAACHSVDGSKRVGASMQGLWGTTITLVDGSTVVVDAALVRRALDDPGSYVQQGYPPSMPSYKGQLTEPQIEDLIAYIASLASP